MTSITSPANKNVQYKSITEERDEASELSPETHSYKAVLYKVYPWRWFMLVTLCFLNVSNGMVSLGGFGVASWLTSLEFQPLELQTGWLLTVQCFSFQLMLGVVYRVWLTFLLIMFPILWQMWLTFAPIPNLTASYYHVSVASVNWLSMSFFAASLFVGFISIYILTRFGLRVTVSDVGLL